MLLKYDIPFIFAEVNADVVYWVVQGDGMQKQSIRSSDVGKYISTKSVGRDNREDITHNYKYPEGMREFRGRDFQGGMFLLQEGSRAQGRTAQTRLSPYSRESQEFCALQGLRRSGQCLRRQSIRRNPSGRRMRGCTSGSRCQRVQTRAATSMSLPLSTTTRMRSMSAG